MSVISDLHLCPSPLEGPFSHSPEAAAGELRALLEESDLLVVAGDLFDLDHSPRIWDRGEGLRMARLAWAPLLKALDNPRVRILSGNHDRLLGAEGVPERLELGPAGRRVLVLHGHQLRRGWRLREGVKAPVKWGAGRLLKTALAPVGRGIFALNAGKEALEEGAGQGDRGPRALLASREDVAVVITGHTHRPGVWRAQGGILANAGTWAYGRADALRVDVTRGEVTLQHRSGLTMKVPGAA